MSRWITVSLVGLLCGFLGLGCSGSGNSPLIPSGDSATALEVTEKASTQTHLWGYYDILLDIPSQTAVAVLDRQALFTANVVSFINTKPAGLGFHINGTPVGPDYIDVDIDVTITHPFPGLPPYHGYDVRGVFMGAGSATLEYNPDLVYAMPGSDQTMLPDPVDGFGGPDGYTRWFNRPEFSGGGSPLFLYTQGKMASPGFSGTATLNAYKYFADGLGAEDNAWTWLSTHPFNHGVFSSGASNKRNYYLRFPTTQGVKFGYAILADWKGTEPQDHPANAPEAVAFNLDNHSTVFYESPSFKGGKLKFDIGLLDWQGQPSKMFIESTVLSSVYQFTPGDMVPTGGDVNYSTYHVEITPDNINGVDGNELWLIAEYDAFDYKNDYGVPNLAGDDPLAAFYRYDLPVASQAPAYIDVLSPNGGESLQVGSQWEITWDSDYVTGTVFIEYSKDDFASDIHTISANEPNDGSYMWINIPNDPTTTARVRISSTNKPSIFDISDNNFSIILSLGWARTWGGLSADCGNGVAADDSGNSYVTGYFIGPADFDPGPGVDTHNGNGSWDCFLSKFNATGDLVWAKTWAGPDNEIAWGVALDGLGGVYVTGFFEGTCDFDPGPGTDSRASNGGRDVFLSKFEEDGTYRWVRTWGGNTDYGFGVAADSSGNCYVAGFFEGGTIDFDPDPIKVDSHTSIGSSDIYLSKFNANGDFQWARTWGGPVYDRGQAVAVDSLGNAYITGFFYGAVDFDPGLGTDNHTAYAENDVFLSKFAPNGDFQWARTWGGVQWDYGYGVATDDSDDIYVTGSYWQTVDFDPGPAQDNHTAVGQEDIFLSKFHPNGDFAWARTWGGTMFNDQGHSVDVDRFGNVYVTGFFTNGADFDPGPGTDFQSGFGYNDIFLSKFSSNGDFIWARIWGEPNYDSGYGVAVSSDLACDVFVTGAFGGVFDFDPGPGIDNHPIVDSDDIFLIKILPNGYWE
jgi:hypothetical protein